MRCILKRMKHHAPPDMIPYRTYTKRLNILERLIHATYAQLFLLWIAINLIFASGYLALVLTHPEHAPDIDPSLPLGDTIFNTLYFSVITATSTGFGDIVPHGFSKVLAMGHCTLSLLVFALLVGKLVSHRQDTTLHEVHRMTFEGIFYHLRHVLFIVRKDFDRLIHKIERGGMLDEQDWQDLSTAYLQAHSLIEEIPELYNGNGYDLHSVDLNREKLLFEALHRTLDRLYHLLQHMDRATLPWQTHAASTKELRRLIDMIDGIMPLWMERSPYHEEEEFEQIRKLSLQLHEELRKKLSGSIT